MGLFSAFSAIHQRAGLRSDFHGLLKKLGGGSPEVKVGVRLSVGTAVKLFVAKFHDVGEFSRLTTSDQSEYMAALRKAEQSFLSKKDYTSAVGFSLFLMWVGAVAANDSKLAKEFTMALYDFGVKDIALVFPAVGRDRQE